jgi:hypothetical protein
MSPLEAASNATDVANVLFIGGLLALIASGVAVALVANRSPEAPSYVPAPRLQFDASLWTRAWTMFAIDWLRRGVPVERETSIVVSVEDAVAAARARADAIAARHSGEEPDSFRIIDPTGAIVGTFRLRESRQ